MPKKPPAPLPARRLLRIRPAADYLGLSVWTMRRLVQDGQLCVVQSAGGHVPWLLDIHDLDRWIEKNKVHYS